MNNNTEIVLGGRKLPLTFGMSSYFTLLGKTSTNAKSINPVQHVVNVVFSGADNYCAVNEKPSPKYADIYELVDSEFGTEEGQAKFAELLSFYEKTTAGTNLYGAIDKKKAQEVESLPDQKEEK